MFQKEELRVLDWIVFFILMAMPIVNAIMIIMILLDRQNNPTLRNFIKAQLLVALVVILLVIGFWSALIAFLNGLDNEAISMVTPCLL